MKSQNDIIADYVREKFPEILGTLDFGIYSLGANIRELGKACREALIPNNTNRIENLSKTTFVKSSELD